MDVDACLKFNSLYWYLLLYACCTKIFAKKPMTKSKNASTYIELSECTLAFVIYIFVWSIIKLHLLKLKIEKRHRKKMKKLPEYLACLSINVYTPYTIHYIQCRVQIQWQNEGSIRVKWFRPVTILNS